MELSAQSQVTVPVGTRILVSRFLDELKKYDAEILFKSRLVSQKYADKACDEISTEAPTVQRFTQLFMFPLASSLWNTVIFLRDIIQACTQSESTLERDVLSGRQKSSIFLPT